MCRHPELYRLQAIMNSSELTITGDLITKGTRVLVSATPGCRDGAGCLLGVALSWDAQSQGGLVGWEKQGVLHGQAGVESWASGSMSSTRMGAFLVMPCAHHCVQPCPFCHRWWMSASAQMC